MNMNVRTDHPKRPLGVLWSCFIIAVVLATLAACLMGWYGVACRYGGVGWALLTVLISFVVLHPMALVLLVLATVGTLALRALSRAWHCSLRVMLLMLALPPVSAALCAAIAALVHAQERCSIGF